MTFKITALLSALLAATSVQAAVSHASASSTNTTDATEWPTYGHDPGMMRYSPLQQITPANVSKLQPVWVYHMKPAHPASDRATDPSAPDPETQRGRRRGRYAASEATPIVIHGVMYLPVPYGRVVALDSTSGREIWAYDLPARDQPSTRGVEYWPGVDGAEPEIIFGTRSGRLIALSAATGKPMPGFGTDGVVNMKTPEVMNGNPDAPYGMSSPPIVYKNLVITGSRVQEMPVIGAAGDVRAWDARTGKLVWTFHSVPRPGELGHDTWAGDSWKDRSGVNVWTFLTIDPKRGILYMPFGAPTFDRWGADRKGDNLFGNSIVAVNAETGKYLWHFQAVHHDIWDVDLPVASFVEVKKDGHDIPGIAVMSKTALLFVLNRVTGKPIFPIREQAVPTDTDIPGESPSPTQPWPSVTPPLAKLGMDMSDITNVTPEIHQACEDEVQRMHIVGSKPFEPLRQDSAVASYPNSLGGVDWGGAAFDPKLGYYIVNSNNLATPIQLVKQSDGSYGMKVGYPTFMDYKTRTPCQNPPWGQLHAVDMKTGKIAWTSTLGVSDYLPEGKQNTGRPSAGGPIVTASGLTFIGATDDNRIRAFDTRTGRELWTFKLPASIYGTPMTYQGKGGVQYLVTVDTGGFAGSRVNTDEVIAFALPHDAGGPAVSGPVNIQPPPEPKPSSTAAAPAATAVNDQAYPELTNPPPGPELDVIKSKCVACHGLNTIFTRRKTPDDWQATVQTMADRGADVTPDQVNAIAKYLSKVLPPPAAGQH